MMSDDHRVVAAWNQGVDDWYLGNYMAAMKIWEGGVLGAFDSNGDDDDDDDDVDDALFWITMTTAAQKNPSALSSSAARLKQVSPLLLFLAGCFLDAAEYPKARRCCQLCLLSAIDAVTNDDGGDCGQEEE